MEYKINSEDKIMVDTDKYTFDINENFKKFIREFEIRHNINSSLSDDLKMKEYDGVRLLYAFNIEVLLMHGFEQSNLITLDYLTSSTKSVLQKNENYNLKSDFVVHEMCGAAYHAFVNWIVFVSKELEQLDKSEKDKIRTSLQKSVLKQVEQITKENDGI